uniref:Ycf66 n=1 Tax=Cyathodium smaragdinum TaxID=2846787 RepID=A0A8F2XVM4_9MARC|nr:hypothetical protein [Cyathodium smaragdinum]
MTHMEFGPSTILGLGLIIIGLCLYALKLREPYVSRDYDFLFSSIGLLCGGILFFQGWRLDPILLLSQILLSGTTFFFIIETLYLRKNGLKKNMISLSDRKTYRDLIKTILYKYVYQDFRLGLERKWHELKYTKQIFYSKRKH